MFPILVFVAKSAAIAVVGIVEPSPGIGIKWFASVRVLAGNGGAVAETKRTRGTHTMAEVIATVRVIVIAILVTVIVVIV